MYVAQSQRLLYTSNMVSGGRHPKKPIADALKSVARDGLMVVEIHRGHRWGMLRCTVCGAIWRCTPHLGFPRTPLAGLPDSTSSTATSPRRGSDEHS